MKLILYFLLSSYGAVICAASYEDRLLPLHSACAAGHTMLVNKLAYDGININAPERLFQDTALHVAIEHKQERVASLLLNLGSNINAQNVFGMTPLFCAINQELDTVVTMLLAKGVDLTLTLPDGRSALHYAVQKGFFPIVFLLIDAGSVCAAKDKSNKTPLDYCKDSTSVCFFLGKMWQKDQFWQTIETSLLWRQTIMYGNHDNDPRMTEINRYVSCRLRDDIIGPWHNN